MLEIIHKILKNEIMYYVIVPIILPIFGWIKNWYDIKVKNKKMGYWKIKYRRGYSFYDIAIKTYIYMMINFFIMQLISYICSFWIDEKLSYISFGIIFVVINIIIMFYITKRPQTIIELWTNKRIKQMLLGILCFIFSIGFFMELVTKYQYALLIAYGVALIVWSILLFKCTDKVFILDKPYADIYVDGAETVKCIYAGSMKKNGGWIYVNRDVEGYDEEIRIKESEIVRIDYYGDPLVIIQNLRKKPN
ncbi:MAG: hypothetical protein HDR03_03180 [Lachnospiraceae bacterium]|nr:hypothetical protein [Lachnospiraceae bacterium]